MSGGGSARCGYMVAADFRCVLARGHDADDQPVWDREHRAAVEYYLGGWPAFERMSVRWRSDAAGLLLVQLANARRELADERVRHDAQLAEIRRVAGAAGRAWDVLNRAHRVGRKTVRVAELLDLPPQSG